MPMPPVTRQRVISEIFLIFGVFGIAGISPLLILDEPIRDRHKAWIGLIPAFSFTSW